MLALSFAVLASPSVMVVLPSVSEGTVDSDCSEGQVAIEGAIIGRECNLGLKDEYQTF